jgi:hypothetical protein
MALQSSGPISLGDIQTEFGGSNPISISEYYGADTGVPGSGTISLSDFYGKSNVDVTPTWTNWAEGTLGAGSDTSSSATFSSINQAITLNVAVTASNTSTSVQVYKNGSLQFTIFGGGSNTFSVASGDIVYVMYNDSSQTGISSPNGEIVITNTSDGNASIKNWFTSTYGGGGGLGP